MGKPVFPTTKAVIKVPLNVICFEIKYLLWLNYNLPTKVTAIRVIDWDVKMYISQIITLVWSLAIVQKTENDNYNKSQTIINNSLNEVITIISSKRQFRRKQ